MPNIIIDSIQVITIYPKPNPGAINLATGELFCWRKIYIDGHLSSNFFPFHVIHSVPVIPPAPEEYSGAHLIVGGSSFTSPLSADFRVVVDLYDDHTYEVGFHPMGFKIFMLIPLEGIYKIRLQASWIPVFVIAASETIELEIDTGGREDLVKESYEDANRNYAIKN